MDEWEKPEIQRAIEFAGELKAETDKGYLINDGQESLWLPKSKIIDMRQIDAENWIFILPEWLAKEKGII